MKRSHLAAFPSCAACGSSVALVAHHIIPFATDRSLELVPSNLLTLCESGRYGVNCHLLIGHCGAWHLHNPNARADAEQYHRSTKLRIA